MTEDLFAGLNSTAQEEPAGSAVAAQSASEEPARSLAQHLVEAYNEVYAERDRREGRLDAMKTNIAGEIGIGQGMVRAAFGSEFDCEAMDNVILEDLTNGRGRVMLGLDLDCEIDTYQLKAKYLAPLEEIRRQRHFGCTTRRGQQAAPLPAEPRLDIAGLIRELQALYGGAKGRAMRLSQVASSLFNALSLGGTDFEVVAGKVTLQLNAYAQGYGDSHYSQSTRETLYRIAVGLEAMFDELDERVPDGLRHFKMHGISGACPGSKSDLSSELSLRFFKSHIRVIMTAAFAEKLREFIASNN